MNNKLPLQIIKAKRGSKTEKLNYMTAYSVIISQYLI